MKKFLLMTIVLAMYALAGFSQIKWDGRVGVNFSNVTKMEGTKALPGFTLGLGMDYGFNESWSFQSGLMFTSKGYKVKDMYKVRPVYLDIPLLGAYKISVSESTKFVINSGPYLSFGLGGKAKYDKGGDHKVFGDDGWKRFDLGIQYGIGFELSDRYLINLTGQHGFICPWDVEIGDKSKNMNFAISLGYRF